MRVLHHRTRQDLTIGGPGDFRGWDTCVGVRERKQPNRLIIVSGLLVISEINDRVEETCVLSAKGHRRRGL